MDAKWVMQAHQSTMDKTSVNIKAKPTIRRHKSKHTKSFQKVQEMITNMKEKFVQNFFDDAEVFIILLISNVRINLNSILYNSNNIKVNDYFI